MVNRRVAAANRGWFIAAYGSPNGAASQGLAVAVRFALRQVLPPPLPPLPPLPFLMACQFCPLARRASVAIGLCPAFGRGRSLTTCTHVSIYLYIYIYIYIYIRACIYPYNLVHHNAGFSPHASVCMRGYARCLPTPLAPSPSRAAVFTRSVCI